MFYTYLAKICKVRDKNVITILYLSMNKGKVKAV